MAEMTYRESAEGVMIGELRALQELRDHGVTDPEDRREALDFAADGWMYDAGRLLDWLGY